MNWYCSYFLKYNRLPEVHCFFIKLINCVYSKWTAAVGSIPLHLPLVANQNVALLHLPPPSAAARPISKLDPRKKHRHTTWNTPYLGGKVISSSCRRSLKTDSSLSNSNSWERGKEKRGRMWKRHQGFVANILHELTPHITATVVSSFNRKTNANTH